MPSFAGPDGRTTTVSTSGGLTANGRLLQELERIKLEKAIAAAKNGGSPAAAAASGNPDLAAQLANRLQSQREGANAQAALQTQRLQAGSQDLASQLANRVQLQREGTAAQAAMQTQRLQVGSQDLASQLANRLQLQREGTAAQAAMQTERLQTGSRDLAAQLANRVQLQREGSTQRQAEATNASNLTEKRKKDDAGRALALFRSLGGRGNALNMNSARAELA